MQCLLLGLRRAQPQTYLTLTFESDGGRPLPDHVVGELGQHARQRRRAASQQRQPQADSALTFERDGGRPLRVQAVCELAQHGCQLRRAAAQQQQRQPQHPEPGGGYCMSATIMLG